MRGKAISKKTLYKDEAFASLLSRLSGNAAPPVEERTPDPKLLYGTKRIAEYLGVSPKTLVVWERDYGLPMRRLNGYCFLVIADLEEWGQSAKHLKKYGMRGVSPARETLQLVGITKGVVKAYAEARGNKCDICGSDFATSHRSPHLDHDHKTNTPRGVLCRGCNHGIGNFKDSPEFLKRAIAYLEQPPWAQHAL